MSGHFNNNAPLFFSKGIRNEELLQFIWQFQYFNHSHLSTTAGEPVHIIHQGTVNKDQGPDFSNARIRIGDTVLAGTVELHLKTSDWKKHGHSSDHRYDNVILHVVFENDEEISNIPVLELQPHISGMLLQKYDSLLNAQSFIACAQSISQVKELVWLAWKERLVVERLARKSIHILHLLQQSNNHWEETFWWMLARNFGMKVNADAFEAIARSIPVNLLAKHKHQHIQLEAVLFGQAGLLEGVLKEHYPNLLKREYDFIKAKYRLPGVHTPVQFLRMRPGNFPTVRLAQLAALVYNSTHLFSRVLEAETVEDVYRLFDATANDYWHYHYQFDEPSGFKKKTTGKSFINNIIINTVVPTLFAYGIYHNNQLLKGKAVQWLQHATAEANVITGGFGKLGISNKSAFDSQALIELKNEYCNHKKCLSCAVGNSLLKKE